MKGVKHIPTERTRQLVYDLYSNCVPRVRIAKRLEISQDCLETHYRKELDEALDDITVKLGKDTLQKAMDGDDRAREFWLRMVAKWGSKNDEQVAQPVFVLTEAVLSNKLNNNSNIG